MRWYWWSGESDSSVVKMAEEIAIEHGRGDRRGLMVRWRE